MKLKASDLREFCHHAGVVLGVGVQARAGSGSADAQTPQALSPAAQA